MDGSRFVPGLSRESVLTTLVRPASRFLSAIRQRTLTLGTWRFSIIERTGPPSQWGLATLIYLSHCPNFRGRARTCPTPEPGGDFYGAPVPLASTLWATPMTNTNFRIGPSAYKIDLGGSISTSITSSSSYVFFACYLAVSLSLDRVPFLVFGACSAHRCLTFRTVFSYCYFVSPFLFGFFLCQTFLSGLSMFVCFLALLDHYVLPSH